MPNVTSSHFVAAKFGAEIHNERQKDLSYIRKDLSHLNETWKHPDFTTVAEAWQRVAKRYQNAVGKKLPKNATPIQETVVVISETTTMEQLIYLADQIEQTWGYTCLAIYTHMDEGHRKSKEWKPNLHAHMIFDTADENGKSLKPLSESLRRSIQRKWEKQEQETAEKEGREPRAFIPPKEFSLLPYDYIQDLAAEALDMERGKKSSKKWLNAVEYKIKMQEKNSEELAKEVSRLKESREKIIDIDRRELLQLNSSHHQYAKEMCQTFDEVAKEESSDFSQEEIENRRSLERESQADLRNMNRRNLLLHFHTVNQLLQKTQKAITRAIKSIADFFNVEKLFDKLDKQEAKIQEQGEIIQEQEERIKDLERQLQQQRRGMGPRR